MGKKGKIGKARKDKFYHLAKETGFRARSAFKLLQLNRKYEFLQNSRVCIDLCAAPGGWLQVAAQNMPVSSVIIGVDLVPIKPIHNVKTFTEDITTDKCRQVLKKELHDWKVDVVLNDGAPNVGKNWVQDAFSQAELTLSAMKLATDFLKKGGWFVTKVFRSKDYQSLMWVFSQLFRKVYATKPQASRNESAEIFVVCQGYLAPDKLDEKFTDPKYVFKEVLGGQKKKDVMNQKAKPKAEGYADDDLVLHHKLSALELVKSDNHMELLADVHEVVLDDEELQNHKLTTDELREYFKDIKVLGRRELRLVLNWRKKMRAHFAALKKAASQTAEVVEEEEESEDEETKMDELVAQMQEEEAQAARKKRKQVLKEKRKLRDKMDLKMVIQGDEPLQTDEIDLFNLKNIKKKYELETIASDDKLEVSESEDEDEVKMPSKMAFDRHNDEYEPNEDDIFSDDNDDEEEEEDGEMEMESGDEEDDNALEEDTDADHKAAPSNPLVVDLGVAGLQGAQQVALWYRKSALSGVLDEEDGDAGLSGLELAAAAADYKRRGGTVIEPEGSKRNRAGSDGEEEDESDDEEEEEEEEEEPLRKRAKHTDKEEQNDADEVSDSESDSDSDSEAEDYFDPHSLVKNHKQARTVKNNAKKDGFEVVSATERKVVKLSPVELAIGEEMIKSGKRRREIIEASYNRYTFNDDDLPVWFLKDEQRHSHKQLPVSKSQIDEQKEKLKAINARPIKKVAEAKARKKKKSVRKLEKVRKKAEAVSETADLSDKEKWNQIRQIYSKAGLLKAKKVNVSYVVAKKGTGKRVRRPAGVQGRFRVVDPRMKKDDMARKKSEKANKGKKVKKGRGKGVARR